MKCELRLDMGDKKFGKGFKFETAARFEEMFPVLLKASIRTLNLYYKRKKHEAKKIKGIEGAISRAVKELK